MGENKILAVVLPTYNRAELVIHTLSMLKEQILRHIDDVDLIVCNNASTDQTISVLHDEQKSESYFRIFDYKEHVDGLMSIMRAIENVRSKYFLLWSDDDDPAPYMIDVLLDTIHRHPDVACITSNRIQGFAYGFEKSTYEKCRLLDTKYSGFEQQYEDSALFIQERWRGMTFMSSDVVSMEAWKNGMSMYSRDHLGWEWLTPILCGIKGEKCIYINYPLSIQRWLYKPRYRVHWASYIYLGIPRILETIESNGCITNWRKLYSEYLHKGQFNSSWFGYAFNMVYWATQDREYYIPLIKEINKYQISTLYRLTTYAIKLPDEIITPVRAMIKFVLKVAGKTSLL